MLRALAARPSSVDRNVEAEKGVRKCLNNDCWLRGRATAVTCTWILRICSVDNIACAELLKPPRLKCDYEIAASTGFTIISIETMSLPE